MTNAREPVDPLEEARRLVVIANDEIVAAKEIFDRYPGDVTRATLSIAQLKLDEAIHALADARRRIRNQ